MKQTDLTQLQKNLNYFFEFRPVSSTEIITENLPGFFSDNNKYCMEFISMWVIKQRIIPGENNKFSDHMKASTTYAKSYF